MAAKTVTRADLCEAVYQKVGLSRTESATLVEQVLKEITDCLERGETVMNLALGDSERWISSKMESGPPENRIP